MWLHAVMAWGVTSSYISTAKSFILSFLGSCSPIFSTIWKVDEKIRFYMAVAFCICYCLDELCSLIFRSFEKRVIYFEPLVNFRNERKFMYYIEISNGNEELPHIAEVTTSSRESYLFWIEIKQNSQVIFKFNGIYFIIQVLNWIIFSTSFSNVLDGKFLRHLLVWLEVQIFLKRYLIKLNLLVINLIWRSLYVERCQNLWRGIRIFLL